MEQFGYFTLLCLLSISLGSAIPKEKQGKDRVYDQKLSEQEHFDHEEHNPEYDHEAFLGKEEAHDFDKLTPEESKERLALIFDKIDTDTDTMISETELQAWIKKVQNKYINEDTERQWKELSPSDDALTFDHYKKKTYGDDDHKEGDGGVNFNEMVSRDERRFKKADKNGDGFLKKEEYVDFLHPEEAEHMREVVVQETLDDIDKNKDGVITEEEYIGDFQVDEKDKGGEDPDWVKSERDNFQNNLDKNKDGKMDHGEIKEWLIPADYDHTTSEANHLLTEADVNKDSLLSKQEVLDKYDVFVGSQATDFGEALNRHDEF